MGLDGRAVQDTWITPSRADRAPARLHDALVRPTLRFFDRSGHGRAVVGSGAGYRIELEGRRVGDDIVQVGRRGDRTIRWTFSRIQADSLLWQGHVLENDGATWRLEVEVQLRRSR